MVEASRADGRCRSHVQRRKLLVALLDHNPQDGSPAVLADLEGGDSFDRLVSMEHVHLPKLADYGLIECDRENAKIPKGPTFDEIRPLIELLTDHEGELPDEWL